MIKWIMAKRKNPTQAVSRHPPPPRERTREKAREAHGRQWLYGTHAVLAAIANPRRRCHRLLVTAQARHHLEGRPAGATPAAQECERRDIERVLPAGAVHQGLATLADPLPEVAIEDVLDAVAGRPDSVVVILDQATDPQNIGAVLRSAAAFGAEAVVMPTRHAPETTAVLAKAASGALETVPLVRVTNLSRAMAQLKDAGLWCVGFDAGAAATLAEAGLSGRLALVMGAEGTGLRRLTRESCDLLVRVPLTPAVESLNLSVAAAIALYEVARNNRPAGE